MKRRFFIPMVVYVFTHILNEFGDEMCSWWSVSASSNFDPTGPEITCVHADATQGLPMQSQKK